MVKVVIIMNNGDIGVTGKPSDMEIVIKDYDVPDDYDPDNENCKTDNDGDRYQEIIFPAKEDGSTTVTLPPMIEQVEFTIRSYYKHCGEEWDADWDSACDDECPVCGKAISPYKHEDIRDFIGWQPSPEDFEKGIAGLQSFEVYENLEHGKGCHVEIKKWIPIYEDDIEAVVIIPYDGK